MSEAFIHRLRVRYSDCDPQGVVFNANYVTYFDIAIAPARLGTTGMTTLMEVRHDGTLVVEGEMRHVFVDPATARKRPIPDDVRRGLEPYLRHPDLVDSAAGAGGAPGPSVVTGPPELPAR